MEARHCLAKVRYRFFPSFIPNGDGVLVGDLSHASRWRNGSRFQAGRCVLSRHRRRQWQGDLQGGRAVQNLFTLPSVLKCFRAAGKKHKKWRSVIFQFGMLYCGSSFGCSSAEFSMDL